MKKLILFSFFMAITHNLSAQCYDNLPVIENFDTDVINVCWDIEDVDGDNNNWMWWEYSSYYGGHKVIASYSFYTSTGALTPDNWIISHAIDLTSFSPGEEIELSWKIRGELTGFSHEYYTVYASDNNQISDFEASSVQRGEYVDEVGGNGNFVTRNLDISNFAGDIAYIAFRHHNSSNQYNINIDDVSISQTTLDIEDYQIHDFHHFYNTNTNELTITSNISIDKINLFDLLGKNVLTRNLSQQEEHINLSNLNDGIYIAKIEIDNAIQTLKFIKH